MCVSACVLSPFLYRREIQYNNMQGEDRQCLTPNCLSKHLHCVAQRCGSEATGGVYPDPPDATLKCLGARSQNHSRATISPVRSCNSNTLESS